jgi:hypothetical protein
MGNYTVTLMTDIIDGIRNYIGRDVIFYTLGGRTACSGCSLDPVTDTSTDSFCTVCGGVYWIPTYSGYTISGHITWGHADELGWWSAGQIFEGDCRVQVKYTDTVATIVDNTEYAHVDGKVMTIKNIIYRGVRELNRILIDMMEKERDDE